MTQPELGKKIAELRKAKGFTQEELVEKCNLSVRTLQRIESGEVTPRSYTIRLIFTALEFDIHENPNHFSRAEWICSNWPGQLYRYVFDLFNLKTKPMKKITILSVTFTAVFLTCFGLCSESKAQKAEKAIKTIEALQAQSNKWANEGKIDSLMTLYRADAKVLPSCSNTAEIREMIAGAVAGDYKIIDFLTKSISVADTIAVQKYELTCQFQGATFNQTGMTEWRMTKGKWLIVNDIWVNH